MQCKQKWHSSAQHLYLHQWHSSPNLVASYEPQSGWMKHVQPRVSRVEWTNRDKSAVNLDGSYLNHWCLVMVGEQTFIHLEVTTSAPMFFSVHRLVLVQIQVGNRQDGWHVKKQHNIRHKTWHFNQIPRCEAEAIILLLPYPQLIQSAHGTLQMSKDLAPLRKNTDFETPNPHLPWKICRLCTSQAPQNLWAETGSALRVHQPHGLSQRRMMDQWKLFETRWTVTIWVIWSFQTGLFIINLTSKIIKTSRARQAHSSCRGIDLAQYHWATCASTCGYSPGRDTSEAPRRFLVMDDIRGFPQWWTEGPRTGNCGCYDEAPTTG